MILITPLIILHSRGTVHTTVYSTELTKVEAKKEVCLQTVMDLYNVQCG